MKIKIIKAGSPGYWYSLHIGKEFEVLGETEKDYRVLDGNHYDSLMADSSEECSVCDYRLKKHDGHFFCNGKSYLSIEPCFLSAICLEYQEKFVSCYCIDAKIEYAEKVYFAILDERLKNM